MGTKQRYFEAKRPEIKQAEGKTRLHRVWDNMKTRCYNPANKYYHRYGGRGITVCSEWRKSFTAFKEWALSNGYSDDLTLDRIDNNKGYSPKNCRWVTYAQQMNNTSSTTFITIEEKRSLQEWAKISGVKPETIRWRLKAGFSGKELLSPKPLARRTTLLVEIDGEKRTVKEWCESCNISERGFRNRLERGITGRDLLLPSHKARTPAEKETLSQAKKTAL